MTARKPTLGAEAAPRNVTPSGARPAPRATPLPAFAFTVERDGTGYADVRSKEDGRLVAHAPDGDTAREIARRWNAHDDLRDALAALVECCAEDHDGIDAPPHDPSPSCAVCEARRVLARIGGGDA